MEAFVWRRHRHELEPPLVKAERRGRGLDYLSGERAQSRERHETEQTYMSEPAGSIRRGEATAQPDTQASREERDERDELETNQAVCAETRETKERRKRRTRDERDEPGCVRRVAEPNHRSGEREFPAVREFLSMQLWPYLAHC